MKKIMTLFAAAAIAGATWAHANMRIMPANRVLPEKQETNVKHNFELAAQHAPVQTIKHGKEAAKNFVVQTYNALPTQAHTATKELAAPWAGYLAPQGSYFCGIDKQGTYLWVNFPTLIGSWLNGYDYWTWTNIAEDATSVEYQNAFGFAHPEYKDMGNTTDADGNWLDSLPALYKGDLNSYFSYRIPLQIVSNEAGKDSFALAVGVSDRLDTLINDAMTLAGIYNPLEDNGFWPMTKAMFIDPEFDFSLGTIWSVNPEDNTVEYIMGSSQVSSKVKDSQGQDSAVVYRPTGIMQMFEKPMSPLYVHDITIAIGANTYDSRFRKTVSCAPNFDTLGLMITDIAGKKILYTGIATLDDTTNMQYIPGAMINFKIEKEDEFGEKTIGMVIDEPYMVTVLGLDRPNNNFGIYTGINTITGGTTYVIDANTQDIKRYFPGDGFIMFNGVMNTLEDGHKAFGYDALSDTIDIEILEEDGEWIAVYAEGDMKDYLPLIAATDLLYDTLTSYFNYEIESPDWAEFDMEIPDNTWEDYGVYGLYIFGDASNREVVPAVGDEIKLKQYGQEIVYRVVGAPTGLSKVKYMSDGKLYNVLGNEVDMNYKGVVIKNGQRYLQ